MSWQPVVFGMLKILKAAGFLRNSTISRKFWRSLIRRPLNFLVTSFGVRRAMHLSICLGLYGSHGGFVSCLPEAYAEAAIHLITKNPHPLQIRSR